MLLAADFKQVQAVRRSTEVEAWLFKDLMPLQHAAGTPDDGFFKYGMHGATELATAPHVIAASPTTMHIKTTPTIIAIFMLRSIFSSPLLFSSSLLDETHLCFGLFCCVDHPLLGAAVYIANSTPTCNPFQTHNL